MRLTPALFCAAVLLAAPALQAQFLDSFDGSKADGWFTMVGDGTPKLTLTVQDGFARMHVDGTSDPYNVWWTLIKRDITSALDLEKLKDPAYELRVEARVRSSAAPRRVNFMINTQRTTDFHEHLREYDLGAAGKWTVISMTTRNFDARPGDSVFVQLCATDYGRGKYEVDVDYYRADVVRRDEAKPDEGEPLPYHPELPPLAEFTHHLAVPHDSIVSSDFPTVNFNDWRATDAGGTLLRQTHGGQAPALPGQAAVAHATPVLTIGVTQFPILRWDFSAVKGQQASGPAVLELTSFSVAKGGKYVKALGEDLGVEFGKVRLFEIIGGDGDWDQATVTYKSLLADQTEDAVFNGQMTFDADIAEAPGGKTHLVLPRPVVQRLMDGRTKGLVLRPLGLVAASFYASEDTANRGPILHFNVRK